LLPGLPFNLPNPPKLIPPLLLLLVLPLTAAAAVELPFGAGDELPAVAMLLPLLLLVPLLLLLHVEDEEGMGDGPRGCAMKEGPWRRASISNTRAAQHGRHMKRAQVMTEEAG
jgi:hypothetical protein